MVMPRKDPALHKLQGTKSQAKDLTLEDDSQAFVGGRLKMPKDYPADKVAVWKMLFGPLQKRKTLTKADSAAAVIIVEMWLRWQKVSELAAANPCTEVSWRDGAGNDHVKVVEHPASKMATSLEHKLLLALAQFSATPASREKTKPTKTAPASAGKELTEAERLDQAIAARREQLEEEASQPDDDLLDSINENEEL